MPGTIRGHGTIYYNGTSPAGPIVFLNVYTNGPGGDVLYTNVSQALPGNKVYAFSARIEAGLVKYTVRFGYVNNGTDGDQQHGDQPGLRRRLYH